MAGFIKKHKKFLLLIFVFSIGFFLIFSFSKSGSADTVKYSLQQCETNTGYSIAYDVKADYHKDKTISHILADGAVEENNSTYRRLDEEITIYHVLDTDINNILGSENKISYDTWDKEVYSADFKGEKIGKGAIFIEILYWDDFGLAQTETIYYTDILNDAVKGDKKELIKIEKKECDVRILLVYEVANQYGTSNEDFRVNYLLKIRNGAKGEVFPKTIGSAENFANEIPAKTPANTDIIKGSTVFNGFYLDFKNNQFYTTEVYKNGNLEGIYDYITIRVRGRFTDEGIYKIVSKNAFGETDEFYITVDRYKPAGKFMNIDLDGNYTFTMFTAFFLDEPLDGFDNRSPVIMKISKDGGEYADYSSGEMIREVGYYSIWLKNDLYTSVIYNFKIVESIIPNYNYLNLTLYNKSNWPSKYYGVDLLIDGEITTYCFTDEHKAFEKAMEIEKNYYVKVVKLEEVYEYRGNSYSFEEVSSEEFTRTMASYAKQNVKEKYSDISSLEEKLVFDKEIFNNNEMPYLNVFTFTTLGPIISDTVYYLRLEDYTGINEFDIAAALNIAKASKNIFKYDIPIADQLDQSGTYLILDTNIYGQTFAFKAYFVKENNAKIEIDYAVNKEHMSAEITANTNELPAVVNYFKITFLNDIYDPYTIVKVVYKDQPDCPPVYYTAKDIENGKPSSFYDAGLYHIICYDRNSNYFEFEIAVENNPIPDGISFEGVGDDFKAYGSFKIYFYMDCDRLEIEENGVLILLIENGEIKTKATDLEICNVSENLRGITIEKKYGIHFYEVSFKAKDGNAEEYFIALIALS